MGRTSDVQSVITCTCGAVTAFTKEKEEEKIHQFVMGLDDSHFGGLCTGIIAADPLPSLGEVYAKIIREEQRLLSARVREQQLEALGFTTRGVGLHHSPRRDIFLCST